MPDTKTAIGWRGYEVIDRDGDKIGTIAEIYLDQETNEPEWATVKTGLFGTRQTFVPIRDATNEGEIVRVPFEKDHVKDAPNVDSDQELSRAEERELYEHYGVDHSTERSASQLPEHGGGPGQEPVSGGGEGQADPEAGQAWAGAADRGAEQRDAAGGGGPGQQPVSRGNEGQADPDAEQAWAGAAERGSEQRGAGGRPDGPERAPQPDEGERGVAVPGESDADDEAREGAGDEAREAADDQGRDAGDDLGQGATTERVAEQPAGDAPDETRLRLKRYVVTEEVRVPVQREEIRVERDD